MLPEIRVRVAEKLKRLRGEKGLSRQKIADYLGLSASSVRFYEEAAREPSLETLEKLATLYGTTVWSLLFPPDQEGEAFLQAVEALPPERRRKVFEYTEEQALLAKVQTEKASP